MFAANPCGFAIIVAPVLGAEYIVLYNTHAPSDAAVMGDLRNRGYFAIVTGPTGNPQLSGSLGEPQMTQHPLFCKDVLYRVGILCDVRIM